MDFSNYKFRASQSYALAVGTIGLTDKQEIELKNLINERDTGLNANGNKVKWTETKKGKLEKLVYDKENPEMTKTMQTALREIYRSVKYNREFLFTNKYVQKGLSQEEESFSTYQQWLKEVKGVNFLLLNNKERITNDFFTGETDCNNHFYEKFGYGFDIKTSWSLQTFPFKEDKLEYRYKWQNMVYMDLTGVEQWKTVYVLVNSTESTLHNEKMKHFYANEMHISDRNEEKYIEICKSLEKEHIVDFKRFKTLYPGHELHFTEGEWFEKGLDIPLKDRVLEKTVDFAQCEIDFLKKRVKIARDYLNEI